jgi:hypothetical protein
MRTIDVNVESLDTRGKTVHGYAAVYGTLSEDLGGGRRERIAPGAFADVVGGDVRALLNHDPNEVLGRTKSGTLRLFDEPKGLRFELVRLSYNDGLDKLILDAIALSGFQAPGTDPLVVSVRKAMTTILGNGYNPDTLLLTPANAEALDLAVTGITGGTQDFVFTPAQFAPGTIFGMQRRISKTIPAAAVVDSQAFGKLYAGPVALASFEENAGKTNSSLVRFEGNAVFGVERQNAAVRIAAS